MCTALLTLCTFFDSFCLSTSTELLPRNTFIPPSFSHVLALSFSLLVRAMNKSFQTSGGTVLSTNWGEVGTTDYEKERQAPAGMQWKTWEGDKLAQKDD